MSDSKSVKLNRDGLPINAKDWTVTDWSDLHNAMERAKKLIAKRHRKQVESSKKDGGNDGT